VHPEWVFDDNDHRFMVQAIEQARLASERGEVPVGCVVVQRGTTIARAGNRREELADPCGHAELLALRSAAKLLGDWRLTGCTMYVTLEPCAMCIAACRQARLDLVIWGAQDPEMGACGSALDLAEDPRLSRPLAHRGGLEADACGDLLQSFFTRTRQSS
jgi:tRNA(adenine34) deaminase